MAWPIGVIADCAAVSLAASYVLGRASNQSPAWAIAIGVAMAFAAALCAVLIGFVMTRSHS